MSQAIGGDLRRARSTLEAVIRAGGSERREGLIGLVAVLGALGEGQRARRLVDDLLARGGSQPWLIPVKMRLMLDAGEVDAAAALAARHEEAPLEIALAALIRAGRWEEAISRYEARVPRKQRVRTVMGALMAGLALEYHRVGLERGARKALKQAEAWAPESGLTALAGATLHTRPNDRTRADAVLTETAPHLLPLVETQRLEPTRRLRRPTSSKKAAGADESPLTRAQALYEDGSVETALGVLRVHLDDHPDDHQVRAVYGRWIVEHGEPADWKAELREIAEHLPVEPPPAAVRSVCRRCGYTGPEAWFVCPRCDALDQVAPARAGVMPEIDVVKPSSEGARLADLLHRGASEEGA